MAIKVRNMESPRSGNPVANQFIICGSGTEIFQSYSTVIAKRTWGITRGEKGWLTVDANDWNYSRTTARYLRQFCNYSTKEIVEGIADGTILTEDLNK